MEVLKVDYNAKDAPEHFCHSLKETGFAVLQYHPLSMNAINQAFAAWADFFATERKFEYLYQKPEQDGYFPYRGENAKGNPISDLKEFYHFYVMGKCPPELVDVTMKVFNEMHGMAVTLLQWIENFLPKPVSKKLSMPLKNMIMDCPTTMLRILHYPPLPHEFEAGAVRAAAHEDINLITLLPAATAPGLEVKDIKGNWHAVNCDPGNVVVNVADTLQMATDFYYKSTTHRVVNPAREANQPRYSMPMFLHARPEVRLSEKYTASEYLQERLREIGIS